MRENSAHLRRESYLILTYKTLRFEILFSSCRNGYKHGNHSALATDSGGSLSRENRNFCPWIGRSAAVVRETAYATCTPPPLLPRARARRRNTRGTKEPTARNAEKWFPLFRRLAQLPFRLRLGPPEIARWFDISSSAILCTLLRLSISASPSVSRFLSPSPPPPFCSPFPLVILSRTASSTAHRKLDAYYFTHCRSFRLSPLGSFFLPLSLFFFFEAPYTNLPCFSPSSTLFISIVRVYTHFLTPRFLPHPFSLPFITGLTVCFGFGKILGRFKQRFNFRMTLSLSRSLSFFLLILCSYIKCYASLFSLLLRLAIICRDVVVICHSLTKES